MKYCIVPYLLMALIIGSCNSPRFVSAPPAMNNPVFTSSGEVRTAAFYSGGDGGSSTTNRRSGTGYDVQAAASFARRFFILGSYSYKKEKDVYISPPPLSSANPFDSATIRYRRRQFEAGAGFFAPLGPKEHVFFKFIAGYGSGTNRLNDVGNAVSSPYTRSHETTQQKLFLQTGFDFLFAKNVVGFIAGKRSYNWFSNINTNYSPAEQGLLNLDGLDNRTLIFNELGWGVSVGYKELPGLRLEGLMNFIMVNNNRRPDGMRYRSRTLNASVGVNYTFRFAKNPSPLTSAF